MIILKCYCLSLLFRFFHLRDIASGGAKLPAKAPAFVISVIVTPAGVFQILYRGEDFKVVDQVELVVFFLERVILFGRLQGFSERGGTGDYRGS